MFFLQNYSWIRKSVKINNLLINTKMEIHGVSCAKYAFDLFPIFTLSYAKTTALVTSLPITWLYGSFGKNGHYFLFKMDSIPKSHLPLLAWHKSRFIFTGVVVFSPVGWSVGIQHRRRIGFKKLLKNITLSIEFIKFRSGCRSHRPQTPLPVVPARLAIGTFPLMGPFYMNQNWWQRKNCQ